MFYRYVSERSGACACGILVHDPTINVEGNRFLLARLQPQGGAGSTPARSPVLPQDPALPLLPTRLDAKNKPSSSPSPYLVLSWLYKQFSILWKVHSWVSESPSSRSSSPLWYLGYLVLSLHVVVQENMCCMAPKRVARGDVQERHTSQESDFSVCPGSQESRQIRGCEAAGQHLVRQSPWSESAGGGTVRAAAGRSVPLGCCFLTQTSWPNPAWLTSPSSWLLLVFTSPGHMARSSEEQA